jgi:2,3-bisphosphoglycerate-independent phosphoglycerate mutase
VPFVIFGGETDLKEGVAGYDEESAAASGLVVEEGYRLMEMLLDKQ